MTWYDPRQSAFPMRHKQQQQQQQRTDPPATPTFRGSRSARTPRPARLGHRGRGGAPRGNNGAKPSKNSNSKALQWAKAVCTKANVCAATCNPTHHPRPFSCPPQRHGRKNGESSGGRIGKGDRGIVATGGVDVRPHQRGAGISSCNGNIVEGGGSGRVAGGRRPGANGSSSSNRNNVVHITSDGRLEHDVGDYDCRPQEGARNASAGGACDQVEHTGADDGRHRTDWGTRTSPEGGCSGIRSGIGSSVVEIKGMNDVT